MLERSSSDTCALNAANASRMRINGEHTRVLDIEVTVAIVVWKKS